MTTTDEPTSMEATESRLPSPRQPRPQREQPDLELRPMPDLPFPPFLIQHSGLYRRRNEVIPARPSVGPESFTPAPDGPSGLPGMPMPGMPLPELPGRPLPGGIPLPLRLVSEELRVDVDGRYPQMTVSGDLTVRLRGRLHWIASVSRTPAGTYAGTIWYRNGDAQLLPQTNVELGLHGLFTKTATVTFSGGGSSSFTAVYDFVSPYFHPVELEYDTVSDATTAVSFDTGTRSDRPANLQLEMLTVEAVFRRAGFDVSASSGNNTIQLTAAGTDAAWSDMEMHDAMQANWSHVGEVAAWRAWALFAGLSDQGNSLGGIMFDDSGPAQRRACAIFTNSFISQPPAGDPDGTAFVNRMRFWTACHELGHTFNLAHSWQKSLGTGWLAGMVDDPGAISFMNYPYRFAGGTTAFFQAFPYRFDDGELLFMRHAPAEFVEQGNAPWFDDHGFSLARVNPRPALELAVRIRRTAERGAYGYEFMEPVIVELKLRNASDEPQLVDKRVLDSEIVTMVVSKRGRPAKVHRSYARYCVKPERMVLMPGEAIYASRFLSAGVGGWLIDEPGSYTVQAALHLDDEDVVSGPVALRVRPPRSQDEERLAQDLFDDPVGRVLAFRGSLVLGSPNDVLNDVKDRLPDRRVALHAADALAHPKLRLRKRLTVDEDGNKRIQEVHPDVDEATQQLRPVLDDMTAAAETFGHVALDDRISRCASALAAADEGDRARQIEDTLIDVLARRDVPERILDQIRARRDALR
jgi:hypothetical protein